MAQRGGSRLDARALFDERRKRFANTAQAWAAERVEAAFGVPLVGAIERETLGHDHERGAAAVVGAQHPRAQLLHGRFLLGNENRVGAGGHARVQGDPADVAAHDLGHHATVVSVTGGAQAIHRLGSDADSRVEAEGVVGGVEVVIDGLGHPDDLHSRVGQSFRRREGAFAADGDEGVESMLGDDLVDAVDAAAPLEGIRAARAENRAALLRDALDLVAAQGNRVVLDKSFPAVFEADKLVPVNGRAGEHGSADDRVQAGGVSARGQHSDAHEVHHGRSRQGARNNWWRARFTAGAGRPGVA